MWIMDALDDEQVVNVLMSLQSDDEPSGSLGSIDNESLDFSQLENFINNETDSEHTYFGDTLSYDNGGLHHLSTSPNSMSTSIAFSASNNLKLHNYQSLPNCNKLLLIKRKVLSGNSSTATAGTLLKTSYPYARSHLPESPPDSSSEPPYSPQDGITHSSVSKVVNSTTIQCSRNDTNALVSLPFLKSPPEIVKIQDQCGDRIVIQNSKLLSQLSVSSQQQQHQHTLQVPSLTVAQSLALVTNRDISTSMSTNECDDVNGSSFVTPQKPKKRKISHDSSNVRVKQEPELSANVTSSHASTMASVTDAVNSTSKVGEEYCYQDGNSNSSVNESGVYVDSSFQRILFQPFQQNQWHTLCDQNLKELPVPHYHVDADKGFNFSNADDAFVCQKKNHFQITCHVQSEGIAQFVKTSNGIRKISGFHLHFYGVKMESTNQRIKVEQSQSDRSKKAFHPVLIELRSDKVTKVTVGRLHFSETTSNNMRKKGKPNPDQRYFNLVVGLHAHCSDSSDYPIVSHSSEKIIVRASNPGQFENDVELNWQRGSSPESVFHAGRVGINTDHPDEALVVHGNVKLTGQVLKPSDCRIKNDIQNCDNREQLRNIQQLNVVQFTYTPEFSSHLGLKNSRDTGLLAQEVQKIIPDAVTTAGPLILRDGTKYENFLLVDKERIYMENVGAVKELCQVTENLETRINELERMNKKLVRLRRLDSTKSSYSTVLSGKSRSSANVSGKRKFSSLDDATLCSNYYIQIIIIALTLVIAVCLASIATLYFMEFRNAYTGVNLSPFLNGEKLNRLTTHWSLNGMHVDSNASQLFNYDQMNNTDLKLILNRHHMTNKLRNKDNRQGIGFGYPSTSVTDENSAAASNSNQKVTKHKLKPSLQMINVRYPSDMGKLSFSHGVNELSPLYVAPALGRPAHCVTSSSSYNSVLHSVDSPSPCQSFCCFPSLIHDSGDENDQSPRDKFKVKSFEQKQVLPDFVANVGQISPAANTLEDTQVLSAIAYAPKGVISNFGPEQPFNDQEDKLKPIAIDLSAHRRKRYATRLKENYATLMDQNSKVYNNITVSIHGYSFNQTINSSYCNFDSPHFYQCTHNTATNISYIIPLSKYLPDTHLYLVFQFSESLRYQKAFACPAGLQYRECPAKNHEVYWMKNDKENRKKPIVEMLNSKNESYFFINISNSLMLHEKYRVSVDIPAIDLCQAPTNKLGVTYLEYNFHFLRTCEE